ncbi:MAG: SDR family oxidoreductase [Cyanobacteria bacterium P01_F01_bin.56]
MRSLLITGASGFLGGHLCRYSQTDWQIWGTYHTQAINLPGVKLLPLDLTDGQSLQTCWDQARPDAVIHTAALSKVGQCQYDPDRSYQINVAGTVQLAKRCAQAEIPLVFTSTDLVFDGDHPPYGERDRPHPINIYGEHKAMAEAAALTHYPAVTICRLPLLMGAAIGTAQCFVQGLLAAIAANTPQTLFTDEIRTPASVTDVVQGLHLVLDQGVSGIWHLGGPEQLSRYDLGLLIAESFDVSKINLQPGLQSSAKLSIPRPKDVSLNSQKAMALGYAPQFPKAALREISQSSRAI